MKSVTTGEPARTEAACRHLAVRVIEQAVRDLLAAGASQADRESARGFLSGSPMLYRWCELANVNPSWVIERLTRLIKLRSASDATAASALILRRLGPSD